MFRDYYNRYTEHFIETIRQLAFPIVEKIMEKLEEARSEGRQVFLLGNGGSASSASHWACDFGKGVNVEGVKRFRLASLTDNMALFSAYGNDQSFADVFVEPLRNFLGPNDVVIGLSVSGNSENVVRAFTYARSLGAYVIAIVGEKEGRMKANADLPLVVPSGDYGVVEDVHMFVNHVISQYLKTVYLQQASRPLEAIEGGEPQ